jgi:hypothetical protein
MHPIDDKFYSPKLRKKLGELTAVLELDTPSKDRILPVFVEPPLEASENNALSHDALIDVQVGKYSTYWARRPFIWDSRFLRFDNDNGVDAARIAQFLELARRAGAKPIPVVEPTTNYYRTAAVATHSRLSKSGCAIRVSFAQLPNQELRQVIEAQLSNLGSQPSDCLLLIDLADADVSQPEEFAKFLTEWLYKLRSFGSWARIIPHGSNYPLKNPAKTNSSTFVQRSEYIAWQHAAQLDPDIKTFSIFGDFGADHGHIDFESGGRAIPHLRYADFLGWHVFKGGKTWETIRDVCKGIAALSTFSGETHSAGDEFIFSRARGLAGLGTPTIWRSVNMNHHLTVVTQQLGEFLGSPVEAVRTRRKAVQEEMFERVKTIAQS